MKALALALLALLVVHHAMHRGAAQRTPTAKAAWANWFTEHRDGGGV